LFFSGAVLEIPVLSGQPLDFLLRYVFFGWRAAEKQKET